MEYLIQIGKKAKAAKENIRLLETARKNQILRQAAADLSAHAEEILRANEIWSRGEKMECRRGFWTDCY